MFAHKLDGRTSGVEEVLEFLSFSETDFCFFNMTFLEIKNLTKIYHQEEDNVYALHNVNFTLERGESLAIVGRSGAGKSTLLNLIGGLDRPDSGEVFLENQNLYELKEKSEAQFRQKNLGFIFQFHHLLKDFNVLENIMMPLLLQGYDPSKARKRALDFLQRVGLQGKEKRYPQEVSGGEQQRVAIARALIHHPKLVLADEPTGNLDEKNARMVFDLLCELNHDLKATLIIVTHSEEFAKKLKRCLRLEAGQIVSLH